MNIFNDAVYKFVVQYSYGHKSCHFLGCSCVSAMMQRTTVTLVQAPTRTRQTACVTIFVWLRRRLKQPQCYFCIAEVNTVVTVEPG